MLDQLAGMGQEIDIPWGWQGPSHTHQWIAACHTYCDCHSHKVGEGQARCFCTFNLNERVDFIKECTGGHTIPMGKDEPGISGWDKHGISSPKLLSLGVAGSERTE